jgi:hypothetical protein
MKENKDKTQLLDRRGFLAGAGVAALGAAALGLASCAPQSNERDDEENVGTGQTATPSWQTPPEPIDEASITQTVNAEVVVVGGGNAGQYAACAAAEAGAKVLLLEKLSEIGMSARFFIGAVDSRFQKEAGVNLDKRDLIETLCQYASHRNDQRLIKLWADNSGMVIDWMADVVAEYDPSCSIHFETDTGNPNHGSYKTFATCHNVQNDEACLLSLSFVGKKLVDLGVEVMTDTSMIQLVREGDGTGRVSGLIAEDENGGYLKINASKGVILCTGGYSGNAEMMREINPLVARHCTQCMTPGQMNVGDGIKAAVWIGAQKQEQPTAMVFDRGGVPVGVEGGCLYDPSAQSQELHLGSQPFLKVNHNGERFCNESVPYDFIYAAASQQPQSTFCMVWDANWCEQARQFETIACARVFPSPTGGKFLLYSAEDNPSVAPIAAATGPLHENVMMPVGIVVEAQTLQELAEKLQIPADTFVATVKRYNELCAKGIDEDFGKESYRMMSLDTPPYRASTIGGQLLCTLDGLLINERLQVLDGQCQPIEGLYAAGNDSGGFFANNYPELVVGSAVGRSITFGFLAGKAAAGAR